MTALPDATALIPGSSDGAFETEISADWAIWGPMGGYIASTALRAAGAYCQRARPASINVHFLAAAAFGPATVEVRTLRTTRVATSTAVTIRQGDRPVLEALVWGSDTTAGLEHHTSRSAPDVPLTFLVGLEGDSWLTARHGG